MTNHEPLARNLVRELDPTKDPEGHGAPPCFVHHPDAGGQCESAATVLAYGLDLCEVHGEEARLGALMEICQDAGYFFERLYNPHVPEHNDLTERELRAAIGRINDEHPDDDGYHRAIARAYPEPPREVREGTVLWEKAERTDGPTVVDCLLDSLATLHRCMRVAFEGFGQTWLAETLEYERESVAAQAAYAMRDRDNEAEEPAG